MFFSPIFLHSPYPWQVATIRATSTTNVPAPQSSRWRATRPWWPLPGTSLVSKVGWADWDAECTSQERLLWIFDATLLGHFGLSIVQFHPTLTSNNITHSYTCPYIPMIYPIISSLNIHRLLLCAGDVMLSDASTGMKQLLKSGAKFEAWLSWCRWGWQGWSALNL